MADRTVSVKLQAIIGPYQAAMAKATRDTREFKSALGQSAAEGSQFTKQLGTGMLIAGTAVAVGFGKMISTGMSFEKQMSGVKAVSGASAAEMQKLSDAALAAGASTKLAGVTASDAAAAEAELVKAGVSVNEILGGALMGSLTLASAGQIEFADAATIASQAMNIFDLKGSEVVHVADVLAAAANKSAADVGQMGDALRQGGLVAAQTGLSLEETAGALAAFADNALVGSDAGTSLKTMLQRLTPQSKEAQELMDELGFSAYDASGNFIGLEGLAGELQSSLGDMTVEQRNAAMAVLFGSDAVRGANVLYEEGADGIKDYVAAVDDVGAAAEMAAIQNDNLSGDIEALGGAIETVLIQQSGNANGVLREMTQNLSTMVNGVASLDGNMGAAVTGLGALTGAASLAGGAILLITPKVKAAKDALDGMGSMGQFASRNMGKFAVGLGVAGVALAGLTWYLGKQAEKQAEAEAAAQGYTDAIREQESAVGSLTDQLALTALLEGGLGEALRSNEADLDAFTATLRDTPRDVEKLGGAFRDAILDLANGGDEVKAMEQALNEAGLAGSELGDELIHLAENSSLTDDQLRSLTSRLSEQAEAHRTGAREAENQGTAEEAAGTAAEEAAPKFNEGTDALNDHGDAAQSAADAVKGYQDALRGSIDPLFGMLDAAQANKTAQDELAEAIWLNNDAIDDNNVSSEEMAQLHQNASESALDMQGAAIELAAAVQNGTVKQDEARRMLQEWVAQGLISQETADVMAWKFGEAANQADNLQGEYVATIRAEGIEGIAQRIANLRQQILGLSESAARVLVLRDQAMAGRGPVGNRRGGIYSYASGGTTPAHIAGPTTIYKYAEPETGGEAFIPKNGDRGRSLGILSEAAAWHGAAVIPMDRATPAAPSMSSSGATAAPVAPMASPAPTKITFDVSGLPSSLKQFMRETVRIEGGGDVQVAFG